MDEMLRDFVSCLIWIIHSEDIERGYSNKYCTLEPVKYRSKIIFLNTMKH